MFVVVVVVATLFNEGKTHYSRRLKNLWPSQMFVSYLSNFYLNDSSQPHVTALINIKIQKIVNFSHGTNCSCQAKQLMLYNP
jgi:hypothetical protein